MELPPSSPLPSAAPTVAGEQIPLPSPSHQSPVAPASLLQLLASPPDCLSSASPRLRAEATAEVLPAPIGSGGKLQCRILPAVDVSCHSKTTAALPFAACCAPPPPRPRLCSLVVAPKGWTAQASSGMPPRRRLQSIIVAPGETSSQAATSLPAGKGLNAGEQDWNLVRSRKEIRKINTTTSEELRLHPRVPPSDPAALQQHLAFKARFNGRCFRCLSTRHRLASCRDPIRCIRCKETGHLARSCSASLPPRKQPATNKQPTQPPPPRDSHLAWPELCARRALMEFTPGLASRRPEHSSCVLVSTPEMEADAYHLRRSALTATAADARVDFATSLVAKALEQALDIPWESIQLASAHPEDYLIRFAEPYQRDLALERGYVRVGGVRLQLEQWDPAPAGTIRHLWFYCRLAISGINFHA
ncbi:hypothetical protein ZWY2020_003104 [Hordeum vulgare]|nr:hypothetical protein ZWY2020_003104 [Hordeum vulgare]